MDTKKVIQETVVVQQQRRRSSFGPAFEGLEKRRTSSMSHSAKFHDQHPIPGFLGNMWNSITGRGHST
ncbi:hypothetical protein DRE_01252 [Drechslerella stenobrocha 248]|uniref:Conidiation-specific protein 8 n=1 Tax=Drechslerella stenobrocha 248 TaxID=1043628 RepID=W7I575_9PEZI|nr:hypothetical protein DRE_01252 [Drechslerella stenobrocha 248]